MHKKVINYINYAYSQGIKSMHMTTNGTLMNKKKAHEIVNSGLSSIMFSIDATDSKTYLKIRRKS